MKRFLGLILFLIALPLSVSATTTVTGTLQNLGTGTVGSAAFVRLWLRGCGGNQPRVNGTALIAPSNGGVFFFDFVANSSGVISGTIYSTRDSTGLLAGEIECGGSKLSVWYGMQTFVGGKGGPEVPVHAKNGGTLDITSVTPITTNPVIVAPTGDSTYVRLDGGNSPVSGAINFTGNDTTCLLNRMYVAGSSCYPTISSAVTAAGATGSVLIPANYAGTDVVPVLNGISIDDRRVTNGLNETRIWSVIAPSFPVTNFPGGNDLVLRTRGSADSYREHLVTKTTTATALNVGANNNILVAAVTVGNLTRGTLQTGDTSLLGNPSILGLSIGRDTANAEVVLGGSWSVVDATHLNITCAKSHASIVDIDLGAGDLLLSVGTLVVNSAVVKATQTSTYNPPLVINDSTGVTIGKWPTNRGDIWPYSAWQFSAPVTGGYSGGVDLYLRALTSAAKLQYWDFAGAEKLWDVSNDGIWLINGNGSARPNIQLNHDSASGNGGQFLWQYNGATSLLISAQADTPHIYGGGTSSGISFYGSSGVAGTSGLIRFRNNGTDETQKASIDTATGNVRSVTLLSDQGTACTNGELVLSANWGNTGLPTVTGVAGTGQTCQWTITAGGAATGANPTITDTLTNALPTATTVCDMRMVGGTGTATLINQTGLSATAPIFTFGGTPGAGLTYIVIRRCGP